MRGDRGLSPGRSRAWLARARPARPARRSGSSCRRRSTGRSISIRPSISTGARPSESSSIISRRGRAISAAADRDHLLLAAGEVAAQRGRAARAGAGTGRARAPGRPRPRPAVAASEGAEQQLIAHRSSPGTAAGLRARGRCRARRSAGSAPRRSAGRRSRCARARLQQAADRREQRALARAVRADERDDLAREDLQRHVPQHLDLAVGDVQVARPAAAAQPSISALGTRRACRA